VAMADAATVEAVTGYVIGSIPPFSWQPAGYRSFLERTLLDEERLGVGAGQWGEEIIITPADLVRASGAEVVNLTDRAQPVSA